MALQTIPGGGLWMPEPYPLFAAPQFSSLLIDATGEMVAFIGQVWNKDRATKNITKVGFRFGSVTKAGGSALTVSLQNVDLVNGPVIRPDGTQDQTVAIANANAAFVANTWIQTAALSANRTVAFGELLAVVIEYDGAGRLGADLVNITCPLMASVGLVGHQSCAALLTGGTWAVGSGTTPSVILEFDDGTFGTLDGGMPCSAISFNSYKSDTGTADEYALDFQVPFPCKVEGGWAWCFATTTADYELLLYSGTTVMTGGTLVMDTNPQIISATAKSHRFLFSQEIELAANTSYKLALRPTTTVTSAGFYYVDVANANHFQAWPGGVNWVQNSRLDQGAWIGTTATRRPLMGLHISALSDGAGGSRGAQAISSPGQIFY